MNNIQVVVDSGSTKSDWLIFEKSIYTKTFKTKGLNPEVISTNELISRLQEAKKYLRNYKKVTLHFFGAGCGTPRSISILQQCVDAVFDKEQLEQCIIKEDTYAAAYATCINQKEGIVCINGTGSNCSYFDGKQLYQKIDSLGYLAMDDFSGVSFGRHIIRAYFFKQLPEDLALLLEKSYNLDADIIKKNFYNQENPNAYLASFLPFLITHKKAPFFQKIITDEFYFFMENYIKQFENYREVPIHFIGSTAYFLQDEIKEILKKENLQLGNLYQKPIEGLIKYYTQNKRV